MRQVLVTTRASAMRPSARDLQRVTPDRHRGSVRSATDVMTHLALEKLSQQTTRWDGWWNFAFLPD
jgi:hypothetical protein